MIEILLILLLVFVVIVLVGHGVWVAIAWLLRGGRSRRSARRHEPTLSDDRAATARFLEHLRSRGTIGNVEYSRLMRMIVEDTHPGVRSAPAQPMSPAERELSAAPAASASPSGEEMPAAPPIAPPPRPAVSPPDMEPAFTPPAAATPAPFRLAPIPPDTRHPIPAPRPAAPARRRPLGEVLAGFMAEKNIRWGELLGGLLIVCCSVALVISLWSRIEAIPVLKFVIFTAVTAGLFGAGLFVYHRWKIPTTGHVVLLVATLLVPLNLVAFAAFSLHGTATGVWTTPIELAAVALFGWLTFLAARVVMPAAPKLFAAGVVGISATALVLRFAPPLEGFWLWVMASVPVAAYIAVVSSSLRRVTSGTELDEEGARRLFLHLGAQSFACLAPFGLIAYESGLAAGALRVLAPIVCALGGPALLTGLFIWRRLDRQAASQTRTAALWVALLATAVMFAGVGLSWPVPARLMPAIAVVGLASAALAWATRHPAFHASAAVCITVVWVLAVQVFSGLAWSTDSAVELLNALGSVRTGQALIVPVAACLVLAEFAARRRRRADLPRTYLATGLGIAVVSLASVTLLGFGRPGDPAHATWIYLSYALLAFLIAARTRSRIWAWCGGVLGQAAIGQMLVYLWPVGAYAWPTALLVGASACVATVVALRLAGPSEGLARLYVRPLAELGVAFSSIAAVWMILIAPAEPLLGLAVRMAWLAGLWLTLAAAMRWAAVLAGAQIAIAVAACAAVQQVLEDRVWHPSGESVLHDPWAWQAHAIVIGVLCLAWAIARSVINRRVERSSVIEAEPDLKHPDRKNWNHVAHGLLNSTVPPADRWLAGLVLAALVLLSLWSVAPGAAAELGWGPPARPDEEYVHAAGPGSWLLAGIVVATALIGWRQPMSLLSVSGVIVPVACVTALVAARFQNEEHVVTALRWLMSSVFVIGSAAVWTRRHWSARIADRVRLVVAEVTSAETVAVLLFACFALPAAALTFALAHSAGERWTLVPAVMPELELRATLFGPAILLAVGIVGYGRSTRRTDFAIATTVFVVAVASFVELSIRNRANVRVTIEFVVWLIQMNAILVAAVALAWRLLLGWSRTAEEVPRFPPGPLLIARWFIGMVVACAAAVLWLDPRPVPAYVAAVGTWWGVAAIVLVESALHAAAAWSAARRRPETGVWMLCGAVVLAAALAPLDTGNWLSFHVLMAGIVACGWLRLLLGSRDMRRLLGSGWQETFETASARVLGRFETIDHDVMCQHCGYNLRGLAASGRCPECNASIANSLEAVVERLTPQWSARLQSSRALTAATVLVCAGFVGVFALRAAINDPQRPWWSVGGLAASGVLCLALGGWMPRRAFAYLGALGLCLSVSTWWMTEHWRKALPSIAADVADLLSVNVIAMALAGLAWLGMELRLFRDRMEGPRAGQWPPLHRFAVYATCGTVIFLALAGLGGTVSGERLGGMEILRWLAWGAAVILVAACRLDRTFRWAEGALYGLGLTAFLLCVDEADLASASLGWVMSLGLSGYVLVTTVVWRLWRSRAGEETSQRVPSWLLICNGLLAGVAVVVGVYVSITAPAMSARFLVAGAPLVLAASAFLAVTGRQNAPLQTAGLGLVSTAMVLLTWAWAPPGMSTFLLLRSVGVVMAVAAVMAATGVGRTLISNARLVLAMGRNLAGASIVGGVALAACAGIEVDALMKGRDLLVPAWAIAGLIVALGASVVCCIVFAVYDRLDPLQVRPAAKGGYIYVAEGLAAAIALHIRATMPWLFSGVITQYWPMLVMGLAFVAIAAAELCARRGLTVLARPLNRTGTLLPLVVVLDLFLAASVVHFSIVLLTAGAFYAALAGLRKSAAIGLLAAAALNGSLWYLLHHSPGLGLARHPQLWFIPPALALLAAGHINRSRLSPTQGTAIHYVCLLVIYLSSTADVFLVGVARAPWLPLVLAGLSLVGVLVGFVSRIRSFLFLGTGFLCLSLLTMIWHAATNLGWTWLWYVSGIALGVGIITMFALFEKKRNEMHAWMDEFRGWSG